MFPRSTEYNRWEMQNFDFRLRRQILFQLINIEYTS